MIREHTVMAKSTADMLKRDYEAAGFVVRLHWLPCGYWVRAWK